MRQALVVVLVSACGSSQTPVPSSSSPAELIVVGGPSAIRTMDADHPAAEAIAIRAGVVTAVGRCADVESQLGPATTVVSLSPEAQAIPGLADAHAHLYGLGAALESIDLRGAESAEAAAARVAKAAATMPADAWVTGRGWDQNLWSPAEFPRAAVLDAAIADHPVAVRRIDGHALWANSTALRLAGIDRKTADPSGGKILREADGTPTGVLIDNAIDLVESKIPAADAATIERRIRTAQTHVNALGLTGVHDMGISAETAEVYRRLAAAGELSVRVYALLAYEKGLEDRLPPATTTPGLFELRAVKMFADGALGSRGAALLAPYSDAPEETGLVISDAAELTRVGDLLAERGYQLAVHAIGDRGNRMTLDAFEATRKHSTRRDLRFRVEHAQVLADADIPRFAALGVIASMQPTHATSDMPWAEARLGTERIRGAYAWRRLLDSGATLAFGSDFPVEKPSPLFGIYAAVTRQNEAGEPDGGWYPDQKLTLDEAIGLFTKAPAFAAFAENHRGTLVPGMAADISIFDAALRPDRSLLERRALMTIVDGRIVYRADDARVASGRTSLGCAP